MLPLFFLLFLYISSATIEYTKLPENGEIYVKPDTRVYFDISSYKKDESILFEFKMNYSPYAFMKKIYTFQIGQTSSTNYSDTKIWENLPKVNNSNVTCENGLDCTYTWTEKKKTDSRYIFIITLTPFEEFYKFFSRTIKVSHARKKMTTGEYMGLIFGTIGGAILVTVIISCLCSQSGKSDDGPKNPQPENAQPILPKNDQITEPTNVQPIAPTMVQPTQPTIGPPPPQPYVHMNEY